MYRYREIHRASPFLLSAFLPFPLPIQTLLTITDYYSPFRYDLMITIPAITQVHPLALTFWSPLRKSTPPFRPRS